MKANTRRAIPRRTEGDRLGTHMLVIGLGGLLLVAAALWLLASGLGFLLVGTILVIMVAYLAAASSRSAQLHQLGPRRGTRWQQRIAEDTWRPGSGEEWTTERADLQRQLAMLEEQNAELAEQLRRLESQQWQEPLTPAQRLAAAWAQVRGRGPDGC